MPSLALTWYPSNLSFYFSIREIETGFGGWALGLGFKCFGRGLSIDSTLVEQGTRRQYLALREHTVCNCFVPSTQPVLHFEPNESKRKLKEKKSTQPS